MLIRPQVKAKAKARDFKAKVRAHSKERHVQDQARATLLPYETKLKLVTSLTYCRASQLI